jgi:imidazoleglycerol-phosphate dehydratase
VIEAEFSAPSLGSLPTSLIAHFLDSFAREAGVNLHARICAGRDDHHKAEALFKALARAVREAVQPDPRRAGIPSTKGSLQP